MKVCILFAIFVTATAAPAPHAIDWERIESLVQVLRGGMFTSGVQKIKTIATSENAEIGLIISAKLDETVVNATILLDNAYAPIQDRNISGRDARELFAGYGLYFTDTRSYIWEDVKLLSKNTRRQISDYFYVQKLFESYHYYQIPYFLDEIPLFPIDWDAARNEVLYIGSAETWGSSNVKEIITWDKPDLIEELFPVVAAAEGEAIDRVDRILSRIDVKNLGLRPAIEFVNELHGVMDRLEDVINEYDWSAEASFAFMMVFIDVFSGTHLAGLQLYDALTGIDSFRSGSESIDFDHGLYSKWRESLKSK